MSANRFSEDFVRCFGDIKQRFGEQFDEVRFRERLNSDPQLAKLAGKLFSLNFAIDGAIKISADKTLRETAPDFPEKFEDFRTKWAGFIPAYVGWKYPEHILRREELESYLEKVSPFTEPPPFEDDYDDPDERDGIWEFDSDRYGAAALVDEFVADAVRHAEDVGRPPTGYRMVEAFDWFIKRGLDLHRFEKRWKRTPLFFAVPQHISDSYPPKGKTEGLYWLLDEAIKAFCFGCDGAAIAMCRTITEELIEKYYLENPTRYLGPNIKTAEAQYPQLGDHTLGLKVEIANKVLHQGKLEAAEIPRFSDPENFIRLWLCSLKELIESAPQKRG